VQRRYQKVVEEAPCVAMPDKLRGELHAAAVKLAKSVGYLNAGTCEFLYDVLRGEVYFMEVNARIQVEHPVTEMVTGRDLVQEQLRIAGGQGLSVKQKDIVLTGHAIECRINAEDTTRDFVPVPGTVTRWQPPEGPGIRLDSHISQGTVIPPFYDSMIGKLIVHAESRDKAIAKMAEALDNFTVEGVPTTIALHRKILSSEAFQSNNFHTRWLEQELFPSQMIATTQ
jgi:acetyl-CoA carboxylase, biotin carboxylase subunit